MEDPQQLVENGQSHQTNEWFGGTTMSGILLMKHGGFKTPIIAFLLGNIRFENLFSLREKRWAYINKVGLDMGEFTSKKWWF